jgi:hypothetical protein
MSDGKFLTSANNKVVSDLIYNAIKKKLKWWMKAPARKLISLTISLLNNKADKFIPDIADPLFNQAVSRFEEGNFNEAILSLLKIRNALKKN